MLAVFTTPIPAAGLLKLASQSRRIPSYHLAAEDLGQVGSMKQVLCRP